jgi:hypothetical protein
MVPVLVALGCEHRVTETRVYRRSYTMRKRRISGRAGPHFGARLRIDSGGTLRYFGHGTI